MARNEAALAEVLFGTSDATPQPVIDTPDAHVDLEPEADDEPAETQELVRRSAADVLFGDAINEPADGDQDDDQAEPDDQPPGEPATLTLPEGSQFDAGDVEAVANAATALGWTQEHAQDVLSGLDEELRDRIQTFRTELVADREIGGTQLAASERVAREVLDHFLPASDPDGEQLRRVLTRGGFSNWRPVVKLLARIGQAVGQERLRRRA